MVDRGDLDHLHYAKDRAIKEAHKLLGDLLARSGHLTSGQIEQAIAQAMPALITAYGDVAATAAAEWYEQVLTAPGEDRGAALLADQVNDKVVDAVVHDAVTPLWSAETSRSTALEQVEQQLGQAVAHMLINQVRGVMLTNAARDKRAVRFALVPRGRTCAMCTIIASRGFDYSHAAAQGWLRDLHKGCDCMVVPAFNGLIPRIKGYDPDAMYKDYEAARDKVIADGDDPSMENIARAMRSLGGSKYTDGAGVRRNSTKPNRPKPSKRNASKDGSLQRTKVEQWVKQSETEAKARGITFDDVHRPRPERVINAPADWPDDLPPLRAKEWYHILYGNDDQGGHLRGYGWMHDKPVNSPDDIYEFPPDWGPQDIAAAGIAVLRSYGERLPARRDLPGVYKGQRIIVRLNKTSGDRRVVSIYPDVH